MTDNEHPEPVPRRKKRVFLLAAIILITLAGAGYWYVEHEFASPAAGPGRKTILFKVSPGMGLKKISRALGDKGIIKYPAIFELQARLRGGASRIRSGTYKLSPSMPPWCIYQDLIKGHVAQNGFTIPEGFNLKEIATVIEKAGFGDRKEVLSLARDPAFLKNLKIQAPTLEGYPFPDTYRFPLETSPRRILTRMVKNLRRKFSPSLRRLAHEQNLTIHETLTLASVIEKETAVGSERPIIAAVFINRLKIGMRLQSDPTVIYSLPNFDGNIRKKDLAFDSPYNTYRYKGLPPGPIASPGLASIRAALNPAPVKYLYFVANREGGHKFSRTYREHRLAVGRYQIRKRKVDR
ncbi:MAG: endolytic transglycosylase MltG [Nitrospinaceae bacterium]|nr:endolytic transglycosylase MltG [Nitrospinaceae bacterium]MBT6396396.1 endolytic transglycosylase MltG [Nitrospinaceae bacterium]